jgi:hypothetical protein
MERMYVKNDILEVLNGLPLVEDPRELERKGLPLVGRAEVLGVAGSKHQIYVVGKWIKRGGEKIVIGGDTLRRDDSVGESSVLSFQNFHFEDVLTYSPINDVE